MPMTPFIGVRISWLMLARNSLLARLAASAASLAADELGGPLGDLALELGGARLARRLDPLARLLQRGLAGGRPASARGPPSRQNRIRKTSSKTTQPACSSQRQGSTAATP